MTGFDIAVKAYINEHGKISQNAYDALSDLFCEYREVQYTGVDSMTAALEHKDELNRNKSKLFESMDTFFDKTCMKEIREQFKNRLKKDDASSKPYLKKCESKLNEQKNVIKNFITDLIQNFIGLSQSAGNKLISIISGGKYDEKTHQEINSLCNSRTAISEKELSKVGEESFAKVKEAAKKVAITVAKIGKTIVRAVTTSAFAWAIIGSCVVMSPAVDNVMRTPISKISDSNYTRDENENVNEEKQADAATVLSVGALGADIYRAAKDKSKRKDNGKKES